MTKEHAAYLFAKFDAARIQELFYGGPDAKKLVPEYRHGWMVDTDSSWCRESATGEKYDMNQGGWAWV